MTCPGERLWRRGDAGTEAIDRCGELCPYATRLRVRHPCCVTRVVVSRRVVLGVRRRLREGDEDVDLTSLASVHVLGGQAQFHVHGRPVSGVSPDAVSCHQPPSRIGEVSPVPQQSGCTSSRLLARRMDGNYLR